MREEQGSTPPYSRAECSEIPKFPVYQFGTELQARLDGDRFGLLKENRSFDCPDEVEDFVRGDFVLHSGSQEHFKFMLDGIPILKMKCFPNLSGTHIGQKDAIFCLYNSPGGGSVFTLLHIF